MGEEKGINDALCCKTKDEIPKGGSRELEERARLLDVMSQNTVTTSSSVMLKYGFGLVRSRIQYFITWQCLGYKLSIIFKGEHSKPLIQTAYTGRSLTDHGRAICNAPKEISGFLLRTAAEALAYF